VKGAQQPLPCFRPMSINWPRWPISATAELLLNETTDQRHWCLLSFLNLAGKPSLIVGETVAYHSLCARVFTVWLVFPAPLFVFLPSPVVQLMATHFVSCPLEPILTTYNYSFYPRPVVDWNALSAIQASRICEVSSFHSFVPLCRTFQPDQLHLTTLRPAVTGGNP